MAGEDRYIKKKRARKEIVLSGQGHKKPFPNPDQGKKSLYLLGKKGIAHPSGASKKQKGKKCLKRDHEKRRGNACFKLLMTGPEFFAEVDQVGCKKKAGA